MTCVYRSGSKKEQTAANKIKRAAAQKATDSLHHEAGELVPVATLFLLP
jgi:hypothetical protein